MSIGDGRSKASEGCSHISPCYECEEFLAMEERRWLLPFRFGVDEQSLQMVLRLAQSNVTL
jgi:hypothetical protein